VRPGTPPLTLMLRCRRSGRSWISCGWSGLGPFTATPLEADGLDARRYRAAASGAFESFGRFPGITAKRTLSDSQGSPEHCHLHRPRLERRKLITRTPDGRDTRRPRSG